MDLYKAIRELKEEKERIERIITSLEAMLRQGKLAHQRKADVRTVSPKRRGRKSMGEDERRQVSERMARYWATKRLEKGRRSRQEDSQPPVSIS